MSSINSSAYYSVGGKNSSSQGLSGLMSGMDTEAMVEKMLSGTQSKIDKQELLKQQTTWKQDIYRDIISNINGFYGKYFDSRFDSNLKTNFANNSFFNTMVSKVQSGNALKVLSTSTSAPTADFRVAVKELAAQASLVSNDAVSGEAIISGDALTDEKLAEQFNKQITFDIGTTSVKVDLNQVTNTDEMVKAVQDAITEASKTDASLTSVTASSFNGKLRLVSSDLTKKISVNFLSTTNLGMQMTGLDPQTKTSNILDADGKITGKMMEGNTPATANAGYSFDLTLDGVTKTISLSHVGQINADGKFEVTKENVRTAMEEQVKKAFGDSIQVNSNTKGGFDLSIEGLGKGHELIITEAQASIFGFTPGSASHINTGSTLSSLKFGTSKEGLVGDRFAFSINGTNFSFNGTDSISKVMNTINSSDAGVRITYSALSDTFKMEATSTGSKYGIDIQQTEGNLLTKLFGDKISGGASATSGYLTTGSITGKELDANYSAIKPSLKMTVNGQEYTFTMSAQKDDKPYTKNEIESTFNTWLAKNFGPTPSAGAPANISYKDGKLSIADGFRVEFAASNVDPTDAKDIAAAKASDLAYALGFNHKATSNIAGADTAISDVLQLKDINTTLVDSSKPATLGNLATIEINGNAEAVSYSNGRLNLKGTVDIALTDPKLKALFGNQDKLTFGDGKAASDAVSKGKDAIIILNGVETTRSSNTFTIDGITMQLTQVSAPILGADGKPILGKYEETVISTERDTEIVIEGFKNFVKDYNEMIDKLGKYVNEPTEYKKYPPLTAEQRKEMSAKEIELWEEKSKQGLIRSDDTVNTFLSTMRSLIYTKPEGSSVALYQIGIETTANHKDGGKLALDETALRKALASDPDAVKNLFTDTTNGLSKQMMQTMDSTAKQTGGSVGSLVQLAGVKGGSSEKSNTLYHRITDLENRIKDLKTKYERERQRYWNQFNSMESVMANFNAQSMSIAQQFGGG